MGFRDNVKTLLQSLRRDGDEEEGEQFSPVARNIETVQGTYNATTASSSIITKASKLSDGIPQEASPSIQVMSQSPCNSAKMFSYFNKSVSTMRTGANTVLLYEGAQALNLIADRLQDISTTLKAQTILQSYQDFPHYIYNVVQQGLRATENDWTCQHWYFLYYPGTTWYPGFYSLLEQYPFGSRFCGYTNQIDTVFLFMLAARRRQIERERRRQINMRRNGEGQGGQAVPVRIHLLIPAHQLVVIDEPLAIPEEIGDFIIEVQLQDSKELVWLNLPETQRHYVVGVGHWVPPQGWWNLALSKVRQGRTPAKTRRVLGTGKRVKEGDDVESDEATDGDSDNEGSARYSGVRSSTRSRRHASSSVSRSQPYSHNDY